MPEDEEDVSDEDTTTSSNDLTANVETTTDYADDSDNDETKHSKAMRKRGTTLTDDSMDYDDDQNATLKPPSLDTTQAVTGLSSTDVLFALQRTHRYSFVIAIFVFSISQKLCKRIALFLSSTMLSSFSRKLCLLLIVAFLSFFNVTNQCTILLWHKSGNMLVAKLAT
ncbi:hypothetical protein PsorP6_002332 [Peronosclerospora sorghi]|uniref:Uncharacterized protein n=1 Tax=Peronosclerospora sorghi TaxID=230839 RepID=A0ACC0WVV1_9STRA|nr:hypothetical protein PsorP6_002332 [Peronosclerospora sorghi]